MTTPDITLYTTGTQNGVKPGIILEELGIPYKVKNIELRKNQQYEPWFLKINPNGKIPAIVDHKSIDEFPNLKAWIERIDARPATQKGLNVPVPDKMKEFQENPEKLEEFEKLMHIYFKDRLKI
ncbi:hypothetical protein RhiirA5_497927 [Rhizophagus irregularis]|uniref:GST N-terminal domain-containing protein n=1 Tax=Rhizophagus irregularis TaxID=588596 RepID=A0A2N0PWF7_9GLOM|nr:hypothetical protein RhiirA5_497927 [Rhizophagus irregularis]